MFRVYKTRCGLIAVIEPVCTGGVIKGFVIKDNAPTLTRWDSLFCNQNRDWDLMEQLRDQDGLYG